MKRQSLAALSLLLITAIWGSTFILVKWTTAEIDLYYFLFLRFLISSIFMVVFFYKRLRGVSFRSFGAGLVLGIFLTGVYVFQTVGLQYTTASNSALITGLYMVLIPFCALIYPRTKPQLLSGLGVLLALIGLFFLTSYSFGGLNFGDVITIGAAMAAAWHIIFTGEFTKRHPIVPLVLMQFVLATIVCGVIAWLRGGFTTDIPEIGWITLVVTSIFASCIAFLVQTVAQRVVDPTRTGIIFAMEAVFGALFGWWLGGERMTVIAFFGASLMVVGMIVSEIHPVVKSLKDKIAG